MAQTIPLCEIIIYGYLSSRNVLCTFATRKMNSLLRHIAPIILLASYLPMITLSSLHVHYETIDAYDDCQQCVGHIEMPHHHDHDCPLCNFISQGYLVEDGGQALTILPAAERISLPTPTMVQQFRYGVAQLRAPPVE